MGARGIDLWDSEWDSIRLGGGNDRLIGFAALPSAEFPPSSSGGVARGGRGKDSLVLSEGVYTVTTNRVSTAETYLNECGRIQRARRGQRRTVFLCSRCADGE